MLSDKSIRSLDNHRHKLITPSSCVKKTMKVQKIFNIFIQKQEKFIATITETTKEYDWNSFQYFSFLRILITKIISAHCIRRSKKAFLSKTE